MADEGEKETGAKTSEPEGSSLSPDLIHYGLGVTYVAAWNPNLENNTIIPMFKAAMFDVEGRRITQTFVLLDDLIEAADDSVLAVAYAFDVISRMKGFKLQMVESKESLVKQFDRMIEGLSGAKLLLSEQDIIAPFENAQDEPLND
jgi:hypothetical protein